MGFGGSDNANVNELLKKPQGQGLLDSTSNKLETPHEKSKMKQQEEKLIVVHKKGKIAA